MKNNKQYRWDLNLKPKNKAWKVVNQNITEGSIFKGYYILSIADVTLDNLFVTFDFNSDDFVPSKKSFSKRKYEEEVSLSNIGYASRPSYDTSYTCFICGGIVAGDRCTSCMFDWDN